VVAVEDRTFLPDSLAPSTTVECRRVFRVAYLHPRRSPPLLWLGFCRAGKTVFGTSYRKYRSANAIDALAARLWAQNTPSQARPIHTRRQASAGIQLSHRYSLEKVGVGTACRRITSGSAHTNRHPPGIGVNSLIRGRSAYSRWEEASQHWGIPQPYNILLTLKINLHRTQAQHPVVSTCSPQAEAAVTSRF